MVLFKTTNMKSEPHSLKSKWCKTYLVQFWTPLMKWFVFILSSYNGEWFRLSHTGQAGREGTNDQHANWRGMPKQSQFIFECLAQGHKFLDQGSKPHSDDCMYAIRTWIPCAGTLGSQKSWFIVASYKAFTCIFVTQWRSRHFNIQYFPAMYFWLHLKY